jgi:hypothetical protein
MILCFAWLPFSGTFASDQAWLLGQKQSARRGSF